MFLRSPWVSNLKGVVTKLWTLDARKYKANHATSMYPLLPAMKNADAELLLQSIDELVERYQYSEAKLARHLLWFSVFLRRTTTVSPQDMLKVEDRLNAFEYLLEHDEYVQKQRILGEQKGIIKGEQQGIIKGEQQGIIKGEQQGIIKGEQQVLLDIVTKRYPALVTLAQQRIANIQKADVIRTAIVSMIDASDEVAARAILDSLLTA